MFFQIVSYFKFLLSSTNKFGVHSPFVYNLITNCFENEFGSNKLITVKNYKSKLFNDFNTINVTDFGAGSKVFKSNKRRVSAIAKNASISNKNAKLLINIIANAKANSILEIGTSLGVGTLCFSLGNKDSKITTLEGCQETQKIAIKYLKNFKKKNINFVLGNFDKTLKTVLNKKYDLIYFDGNHQKEATINYFEKCLPYINNETIFIFDDINWSKEMNQVWQFIKNHKKVTLTIDIFYWGIVFFRYEQFEKEHFKLRI